MRLIIDCDPGNGVPGANVDDGLAIALALSHNDSINLEAVSTVSGNTPCAVGANIARHMLKIAGNNPDRVWEGASEPLLGKDQAWREHLDRAERQQLVREIWKDTAAAPTHSSGANKIAALEIGKVVTESPGQVSVVAIGPLTNIALAMKLFPSFEHDVAEIIIMGGAFDVDGYNVDTNFGVDPEAAHIVMRSSAAKCLLPLDVTTQTLLSSEDLLQLEGSADALTSFVYRTTRPWLEFSTRTRGLEGSWVHDAVAVAALIDPSIIATREYYVDVELAVGNARGKALRWPVAGFSGDPKDSAPLIGATRVARSVDNQKLIHLLVASLRARG
jgi:inosine-uridine nucleoside N-ribohydrolase